MITVKEKYCKLYFGIDVEFEDNGGFEEAERGAEIEHNDAKRTWYLLCYSLELILLSSSFSLLRKSFEVIKLKDESWDNLL